MKSFTHTAKMKRETSCSYLRAPSYIQKALLLLQLPKASTQTESQVIQAERDFRRSVVLHPAQSRVGHKVRPGCSWFYSSRSWQPLRMETPQSLCQRAPLLGFPSSGKKEFHIQAKSPCFSLCLLSLTLLSYAAVNSLILPLRSPLRRFWGCQEVAPKPSLLKAELDPAKQMLQPLTFSVASAELTPVFHCLSCIAGAQYWMQYPNVI